METQDTKKEYLEETITLEELLDMDQAYEALDDLEDESAAETSSVEGEGNN